MFLAENLDRTKRRLDRILISVYVYYLILSRLEPSWGWFTSSSLASWLVGYEITILSRQVQRFVHRATVGATVTETRVKNKMFRASVNLHSCAGSNMSMWMFEACLNVVTLHSCLYRLAPKPQSEIEWWHHMTEFYLWWILSTKRKEKNLQVDSLEIRRRRSADWRGKGSNNHILSEVVSAQPA